MPLWVDMLDDLAWRDFPLGGALKPQNHTLAHAVSGMWRVGKKVKLLHSLSQNGDHIRVPLSPAVGVHTHPIHPCWLSLLTTTVLRAVSL